jgi:hypothetical protein
MVWYRRSASAVSVGDPRTAAPPDRSARSPARSCRTGADHAAMALPRDSRARGTHRRAQGLPRSGATGRGRGRCISHHGIEIRLAEDTCRWPSPAIGGDWRARGGLTWRMGWDSNPRYGLPHGGFQDRCLKPLGHPSCAIPFRLAASSCQAARGSCGGGGRVRAAQTKAADPEGRGRDRIGGSAV